MAPREIHITYFFEPSGEGVCIRCERWQTETYTLEFADQVMCDINNYPAQFCMPCIEIFKKGLKASDRNFNSFRHGLDLDGVDDR